MRGGEAVMAFDRRYLCRLDPWPEAVLRSLAGYGAAVHEAVIGPGGLHLVGRLKAWDVRPRAAGIRLPSLITSGRLDESTPRQAEALRDAISGSRWVRLERVSQPDAAAPARG